MAELGEREPGELPPRWARVRELNGCGQGWGALAGWVKGESVKGLVAQSDSCDPMDCSPPGSSVHGISQARILEWVAFLFSRGSS